MLNQDQKAENTNRKTLLSAVADATNSKAKFTPGPWSTPLEVFTPMARETAGHSPQHYKAIGIGNGCVHISYASVTPNVSEEEAKANAALIASAPDLLAQRDELREAIESAIIDCETLDQADLRPAHQTTLTTLRESLQSALSRCAALEAPKGWKEVEA